MRLVFEEPFKIIESVDVSIIFSSFHFDPFSARATNVNDIQDFSSIC